MIHKLITTPTGFIVGGVVGGFIGKQIDGHATLGGNQALLGALLGVVVGGAIGTLL